MGYRNLVMIGDGITDLEASPPADVFIGFGGNKVILLIYFFFHQFVSLNKNLFLLLIWPCKTNGQIILNIIIILFNFI